MSRRGLSWIAGLALVVGSPGMMAARNGWMHKVPDAERGRANPYAGRPEAIAAGRVLYEDHCAKCHGADALGRHRRPSLRGEDVREATDGELFWLLKNGSVWRGMPSWISLPEQERWQVIAYLRSLPPAPSDPRTARP